MFLPFNPKTIEYTDTTCGKLRGYKLNDVYAFLGVPYGECKRWQKATPVKPWKGIRNALNFGPRMFPSYPFTPWDSCGVAHEAYDYAEDALNLNIWTPSIEKNAKKPVMVWIHGGAFESGSAMEMQAHEGSNLSRFGDVVMVGLNHRLNIFGFCDMSRFGEKYIGSANASLSDLVLALQWVHDNIENFGGDPGNVMIFGQSGGGMKVTALMQIPAARNLFQKAGIMSGTMPGGTAKADNTYSIQVIDALLEKYETKDPTVLEELTPEELLDAMHEVTKDWKTEGLSWHPIVDDYYPGYPFDVGFSDFAKTVPVIMGSTISEMPFMRIYNKNDYSEEQKMGILKEAFPDQDVDHLVELFRKAWPNKCITDAIEMTGILNFRPADIRFCDLRSETCSAPTYVYVLGHDFPQEGGRGAWHCSDIPMAFRNAEMYPDSYKDGLMDGLQDAFCASLVNFAHSSDPNNEYLKVQWPSYTKEEGETMIFDDTCEVRNNFDRELIAYRNSLKLNFTKKLNDIYQLIN